MEKGEKLTGGPYWTQNWIEAMWRFTAERFVDFDTGTVDFEALGREEYEFRKALFFRNFKNSPRARESFDAAADDYGKKVANGQKGGRPRKDTTAGAPTREDGESKSDSGNAGNLEPATSANIYGDAATSDGAEAFCCRESGATAPTTVSMNMRRVPQTEAPAHGFSGGRTAQGTMSRSPEAAAQSGKDYDQETCRRISTDEALDLLRAGVMAPSQDPTRNGSAMPSDVGEVYAFASAEGLDSVDAYECWSATIARGGKTADGRKVRNWKAYVRRWCATRAEKRRTA